MTKEQLLIIVESQQKQLDIYKDMVQTLQEKIAIYEQIIKLEANDV